MLVRAIVCPCSTEYLAKSVHVNGYTTANSSDPDASEIGDSSTGGDSDSDRVSVSVHC